jgi:hypothetical protein
MALATNPMTTGETKHIDIRYHFIREVVNSKAVTLEYCPTTDLLADVLTMSKLVHSNNFDRELIEIHEIR